MKEENYLESNEANEPTERNDPGQTTDCSMRNKTTQLQEENYLQSNESVEPTELIDPGQTNDNNIRNKTIQFQEEKYIGSDETFPGTKKTEKQTNRRKNSYKAAIELSYNFGLVKDIEVDLPSNSSGYITPEVGLQVEVEVHC